MCVCDSAPISARLSRRFLATFTRSRAAESQTYTHAPNTSRSPRASLLFSAPSPPLKTKPWRRPRSRRYRPRRAPAGRALQPRRLRFCRSTPGPPPRPAAARRRCWARCSTCRRAWWAPG
ncbi:hypothetical protein GQ55_5G109300 [Panicum hallii var. hallii]|uniref:Uncharacterized protein n=1 Tax=Panicum hallii var. hallii TaxID=1504633 RepID=A0A2T7DF28_9POAL|nr:hypothetical protein GQ55_5G109300 [Panicum hallii var. hallii]